MRFCFTPILNITIMIGCLAASAQGQAKSRSANGHFLIDHNRIFVELGFIRPDGSVRKTLAYVDSGDPNFEFTSRLAKELGVDKNNPIRARFAGMDLKVNPQIEASASETESMAAGMTVEANLPSTVLDQYDVLLDYGKHSLTIAAPGTLQHAGIRIPCKVNAKTGLLSVQAKIGGGVYEFSVDNGAAYTWIDDAVTKKWVEMHPKWLRGTGAVGDANMNGSVPELTGMIMRLPEIDLDGLRLNSTGVLGVGPGWDATMPRFFKWYSQKTPAPVTGFLGGNVLKDFCLEIDYEHRATYWTRETESNPHDLDQVGIMIVPRHGEYFVMGLATQNGKVTVDGIEVNDQLLSVDGVTVTGTTMGKVLTALHGRPGEIRRLVLERNGESFSVSARVTRF